jgi:hypothetical protein
MEKLETSIRQRLACYLAGDMSLNDFQDWLVGATWHIDDKVAPEAAELTYSIEHALAEASTGLLSREELDAELRSLLGEPSRSLAHQSLRRER